VTTSPAHTKPVQSLGSAGSRLTDALRYHPSRRAHRDWRQQAHGAQDRPRQV